MDERDLRIRNHLYARFVDLGRAPTFDELGDELGLGRSEIEASLRRLHEARAVVLERDGTALRMLNPFSVVETPYRVEAEGRTWFGNCAWDSFGILAALGADGRVETTCPDCDEPVAVKVRGESPAPDDYVVHILVPAPRWWDDIVFS